MSDPPSRLPATATAELDVSRLEGEVLLLRLHGNWRLAAGIPSPARVRQELGDRSRLVFDRNHPGDAEPVL